MIAMAPLRGDTPPIGARVRIVRNLHLLQRVHITDTYTFGGGVAWEVVRIPREPYGTTGVRCVQVTRTVGRSSAGVWWIPIACLDDGWRTPLLVRIEWMEEGEAL